MTYMCCAVPYILETPGKREIECLGGRDAFATRVFYWMCCCC